MDCYYKSTQVNATVIVSIYRREIKNNFSHVNSIKLRILSLAVQLYALDCPWWVAVAGRLQCSRFASFYLADETQPQWTNEQRIAANMPYFRSFLIPINSLQTVAN